MPRRERGFIHSDFDVEYGLASASVTHGKTILATTQANYHGIAVVASASNAVVTIYDNTDTSGTLVDTFIVASNKDVWIDRYIPVIARTGLCVKIVGTGADGVAWYGPKG